MDDLIDLIDLISSQKTRNLSVVPSPYSNTKINQLYKKIESREITDEEGILNYFYEGRSD